MAHPPYQIYLITVFAPYEFLFKKNEKHTNGVSHTIYICFPIILLNFANCAKDKASPRTVTGTPSSSIHC